MPTVSPDGELNPPEWNTQGREVNVYKEYGYVPFDVLDASSTGRQTRESSRTLEVRTCRLLRHICLCYMQYAFEDFAIRQVALLLNQSSYVSEYTNRSFVCVPFRNIV